MYKHMYVSRYMYIQGAYVAIYIYGSIYNWGGLGFIGFRV